MTEHHAAVVRARLVFAYDGTDFQGWAIQPHLRTVQGVLEAALNRITRSDDIRVTVAGRTDAGVHARGQVAHVDIPLAAWNRMPGHQPKTPEEGMFRRLNGVLPPDIRVHTIDRAPEGFDARFGALERRYAYRVGDSHLPVDPLTRRYVLALDRALDVDVLNAASGMLTGLRDFAAFCRPREGATTVRTLTELSWRRVTEGSDTGLVVATVRADAFCHSMVRALVGALLPVGYGRRDEEWLARIASSIGRSDGIKVAKPHGLTLEEVVYPPDAEVAARAALTRARRAL